MLICMDFTEHYLFSHIQLKAISSVNALENT